MRKKSETKKQCEESGQIRSKEGKFALEELNYKPKADFRSISYYCIMSSIDQIGVFLDFPEFKFSYFGLILGKLQLANIRFVQLVHTMSA